MNKGRLEAFSDGVLAILITILVLGLREPAGASLSALRPLGVVFLSYLLSFAYLAIYWNNHHHMLQTCVRVTGPMLWANMHLLFWLSLIPWATAWMGASRFAPAPVAVYGAILLMAALAYMILQAVIISVQGPDSLLKEAVGSDWKGKVSPLLYAAAIAAAFFVPRVSGALYALVAALWLVPDPRIENALRARRERLGN
ncbi:MAG: DUF1211 domain-containing protein [Elusimicrobia bacterium]|nr:DUF1211 domain-containing protein [Elusimicrobiota bacterium]